MAERVVRVAEQQRAGAAGERARDRGQVEARVVGVGVELDRHDLAAGDLDDVAERRVARASAPRPAPAGRAPRAPGGCRSTTPPVATDASAGTSQPQCRCGESRERRAQLVAVRRVAQRASSYGGHERLGDRLGLRVVHLRDPGRHHVRGLPLERQRGPGLVVGEIADHPGNLPLGHAATERVRAVLVALALLYGVHRRTPPDPPTRPDAVAAALGHPRRARRADDPAAGARGQRPATAARADRGRRRDGWLGVRSTDWRQLGQPAGPLRTTDRTDRLDHLPMDTIAVVVGRRGRTGGAGGDGRRRRPAARPGGVPDPGRGPRARACHDADGRRRHHARARGVTGRAGARRRCPIGLRGAPTSPSATSRARSSDARAADAGPGDSFHAPPDVRRDLRDAGFDALGLANNHTGDFGDAGPGARRSSCCATGGLATFGAGRDLAEAREPVVLERHGMRFGFLGFNAIGETARGRPGSAGRAVGEHAAAHRAARPARARPGARRRTPAAAAGRRRRRDAALGHAVHAPARADPASRSRARWSRAGADLVVGGHPHWVQGARPGRRRAGRATRWATSSSTWTHAADQRGAGARGDVLGRPADGGRLRALPDRRRLRAAGRAAVAARQRSSTRSGSSARSAASAA